MIEQNTQEEYQFGYLEGKCVAHDMIHIYVTEETHGEIYFATKLPEKILENAMWLCFYALNDNHLKDSFEQGFLEGVRHELHNNELTKKFYHKTIT